MLYWTQIAKTAQEVIDPKADPDDPTAYFDIPWEIDGGKDTAVGKHGFNVWPQVLRVCPRRIDMQGRRLEVVLWAADAYYEVFAYKNETWGAYERGGAPRMPVGSRISLVPHDPDRDVDRASKSLQGRTKAMFVEFVRSLPGDMTTGNAVAVMDNAPIHWTGDREQLAEGEQRLASARNTRSAGRARVRVDGRGRGRGRGPPHPLLSGTGLGRVEFTPPYKPEANPIERLFGWVKRRVPRVRTLMMGQAYSSRLSLARIIAKACVPDEPAEPGLALEPVTMARVRSMVRRMVAASGYAMTPALLSSGAVMTNTHTGVRLLQARVAAAVDSSRAHRERMVQTGRIGGNTRFNSGPSGRRPPAA